MLTEDRIQKTKALLSDADLAFDQGRFREGSRMMWEAARLSVVAVADSKGWPSETLDDLKQVVFRLDGIDENGKFTSPLTHWPGFSAANGYREQAETDDEDWPTLEFKWMDLEFRMYQKSVEAFIELMERHLKESGKFPTFVDALLAIPKAPPDDDAFELPPRTRDYNRTDIDL